MFNVFTPPLSQTQPSNQVHSGKVWDGSVTLPAHLFTEAVWCICFMRRNVIFNDNINNDDKCQHNDRVGQNEIVSRIAYQILKHPLIFKGNVASPSQRTTERSWQKVNLPTIPCGLHLHLYLNVYPSETPSSLNSHLLHYNYDWAILRLSRRFHIITWHNAWNSINDKKKSVEIPVQHHVQWKWIICQPWLIDWTQVL